MALCVTKDSIRAVQCFHTEARGPVGTGNCPELVPEMACLCADLSNTGPGAAAEAFCTGAQQPPSRTLSRAVSPTNRTCAWTAVPLLPGPHLSRRAQLSRHHSHGPAPLPSPSSHPGCALVSFEGGSCCWDVQQRDAEVALVPLVEHSEDTRFWVTWAHPACPWGIGHVCRSFTHGHRCLEVGFQAPGQG